MRATPKADSYQLGSGSIDLLQTCFSIRRFANGQQVSALRVKQEQQAIEQSESSLEDLLQFLIGWSLLVAEALLAILQKAHGQVWKDRDKNMIFQSLAEALGVVTTASDNQVKPAADFLIGLDGCKGFGAEEQPPISKRLVGISVA